MADITRTVQQYYSCTDNAKRRELELELEASLNDLNAMNNLLSIISDQGADKLVRWICLNLLQKFVDERWQSSPLKDAIKSTLYSSYRHAFSSNEKQKACKILSKIAVLDASYAQTLQLFSEEARKRSLAEDSSFSGLRIFYEDYFKVGGLAALNEFIPESIDIAKNFLTFAFCNSFSLPITPSSPCSSHHEELVENPCSCSARDALALISCLLKNVPQSLSLVDSQLLQSLFDYVNLVFKDADFDVGFDALQVIVVILEIPISFKQLNGFYEAFSHHLVAFIHNCSTSRQIKQLQLLESTVKIVGLLFLKHKDKMIAYNLADSALSAFCKISCSQSHVINWEVCIECWIEVMRESTLLKNVPNVIFCLADEAFKKSLLSNNIGLELIMKDSDKFKAFLSLNSLLISEISALFFQETVSYISNLYNSYYKAIVLDGKGTECNIIDLCTILDMLSGLIAQMASNGFDLLGLFQSNLALVSAHVSLIKGALICNQTILSFSNNEQYDSLSIAMLEAVMIKREISLAEGYVIFLLERNKVFWSNPTLMKFIEQSNNSIIMCKAVIKHISNNAENARLAELFSSVMSNLLQSYFADREAKKCFDQISCILCLIKVEKLAIKRALFSMLFPQGHQFSLLLKSTNAPVNIYEFYTFIAEVIACFKGILEPTVIEAIAMHAKTGLSTNSSFGFKAFFTIAQAMIEETGKEFYGHNVSLYEALLLKRIQNRSIDEKLEIWPDVLRYAIKLYQNNWKSLKGEMNQIIGWILETLELPDLTSVDSCLKVLLELNASTQLFSKVSLASDCKDFFQTSFHGYLRVQLLKLLFEGSVTLRESIQLVLYQLAMQDFPTFKSKLQNEDSKMLGVDLSGMEKDFPTFQTSINTAIERYKERALGK